jgi:hypothetical protein
MTSLESQTETTQPRGEPIRVLFIAGSGRSGSTLLDRIIGMNDGFCSIGEAHFVWERSFEQNQLCSCGLPFHECPFWGGVSRKAFGVDASHFDAAAAIEQKASVDRTRFVPWLAMSHRPRSYQSALLTYGKLLEDYYAAILDISGAHVIVDSSKNPTHGFILSRLPNVEVHIVHLIRDPRAVAFSWLRRRRRPEIHWAAEDMPIEHVWKTAARWVMHNTFAELLSRSANSYCRLHYEDFLADPNAAMSKLMAPYEWTRDRLKDPENMEIVLEPTHSISGNPMRFKSGQFGLKLDDEWRRAMQPKDRRLATAMTWPLLLRYGYRIGDRL